MYSLPLDTVFDPAGMRQIIFFFPKSFHSVEIVCLSELKTIGMNLIASEAAGTWGSTVNECLAVLLLGQFEYVFLIGL